MLRSWLVGVFVLGLTAFCLVSAYWSDGLENPGQGAEGGADRAEPAVLELRPLNDSGSGEAEEVTGPGAPLSPSYPLADGEWVPATDSPDSGAQTELQMVARAGSTGGEEGGAESLGAVSDPLVAMNGADGPSALDLDFSIPGGAVAENSQEARAEAREFVTMAHGATSDLQAATYLTQALLCGGLTEEEDRQAYRSLLDINRRGLFHRSKEDGCYRVTVRRGDSLWGICRRLEKEGHPSIESGLIQLFNGMRTTAIYEGQQLKVPTEPLSIVVETGKYRLNALVGGVLIRRFPVGLGKPTTPTPLGKFTIGTRETEPTWYKPGTGPLEFGHKENVLGTRWLGFESLPDFPNANTFGVHGTWAPESIGGNQSNGCVRMRNEDVEALFDWVALGTKIEIRP